MRKKATISEKNSSEAKSASIVEVGDFARLDIGREKRCIMPEIVYAEGKTQDQTVAICERMIAESGNTMASRVSPETGKVLTRKFGGTYDQSSRIFFRMDNPPEKLPGKVILLCAGTSDLPVAGACKYALDFCGADSEIIADAGIAGIERLFAVIDRLRRADVVVAFAGMEGALPSVLGGLIDCPIVAVPCSIGYGVSAGGFAALNSMLASCAPGITVVNIDNGIGAAAASVRILKKLR